MYVTIRLSRGDSSDEKPWILHGVDEANKNKPVKELKIKDPVASLTESEWWKLVEDYNIQCSDPRDRLYRRGV